MPDLADVPLALLPYELQKKIILKLDFDAFFFLTLSAPEYDSIAKLQPRKICVTVTLEDKIFSRDSYTVKVASSPDDIDAFTFKIMLNAAHRKPCGFTTDGSVFFRSRTKKTISCMAVDYNIAINHILKHIFKYFYVRMFVFGDGRLRNQSTEKMFNGLGPVKVSALSLSFTQDQQNGDSIICVMNSIKAIHIAINTQKVLGEDRTVLRRIFEYPVVHFNTCEILTPDDEITGPYVTLDNGRRNPSDFEASFGRIVNDWLLGKHKSLRVLVSGTPFDFLPDTMERVSESDSHFDRLKRRLSYVGFQQHNPNVPIRGNTIFLKNRINIKATGGYDAARRTDGKIATVFFNRLVFIFYVWDDSSQPSVDSRVPLKHIHFH